MIAYYSYGSWTITAHATQYYLVFLGFEKCSLTANASANCNITIDEYSGRVKVATFNLPLLANTDTEIYKYTPSYSNLPTHIVISCDTDTTINFYLFGMT